MRDVTTKFLVLGCLAVFLLSACSGMKSSLQKMGLGKSTAVRYTVPRRQLLDEGNVPAHIKLASAALVLKMRHKAVPSRLVVFDPQGSHRVQEKNFDYSGFRWTLLDIIGFEAKKINKKQIAVSVQGLLHFTDSLNRMCSSSFALNYILQKHRPLKITASRIVHVKPIYPLVKAYFVPLQALRADFGRMKTFRDVYNFALSHAVPMYATAEQIKAKAQWDSLPFMQKMKTKPPQTSIEGDWAVLVFCMDRLAPDSVLDVKVAAGSAVAQSKAQPVVLRYNGWRIAIVSGHGFIHDPRRSFSVRAYYLASAGDKSKPVMVGKFDSRLAYSKPVRHRLPAGPLETGARKLNPGKIADARIIQARLKTLGYYNMKVDGRFGPGSQRALDAFCKDVVQSAKCSWSLEVQKALFKGSGL